MYIELESIKKITYGGYSLTLPGNIKRYIDFENSTVILVNSSGKLQLLFILLKLEDKGVSNLSIVNTFDIEGDLINFKQVTFQGIESLNIRINDIIYIFNPNDGKVILETSTKG